MSFIDAAAIPEVWLTAYQLISKVAKAEKPKTRRSRAKKATGGKDENTESTSAE